MTVYSAPGNADSLVSVKSRYDHFIGGEWVAPVKGAYFENISPVNGRPSPRWLAEQRRTSRLRWTPRMRLRTRGVGRR